VANVLQPSQVALDVHPDRSERVEFLVGAPAQEDPQVRLAVQPGLTTVAAEVCGCRRAEYELVRRPAADGWDEDGSHNSPCVTCGDERQCAGCGMSGNAIKHDLRQMRTSFDHRPELCALAPAPV
jgi:hypothetical protein